jgi:hypothetical protein
MVIWHQIQKNRWSGTGRIELKDLALEPQIAINNIDLWTPTMITQNQRSQ